MTAVVLVARPFFMFLRLHGRVAWRMTAFVEGDDSVWLSRLNIRKYSLLRAHGGMWPGQSYGVAVDGLLNAG